MNILSVIATVSSPLCLFMGLYILFLDRKKRVNILFFNLCFWLFLTHFFGIFAYSANSIEKVIFNCKLVISGFTLFYPSVLLFFIHKTRLVKTNSLTNCIFFLPSIIFIILEVLVFKGNIIFLRYYKVNNYWTVDIRYNFISILCFMYFYFCIISSLVLIAVWRKKTDYKKVKMQADIIFYSLFFLIVLNTIDTFILPIFTTYKSFAISPITHFIWVVALWIAILKYKFLSITPEVVSHNIISNIDEAVILLDQEANIMRINNKAEELLNIKNDDIKNNSIKILFENQEKIFAEINKLKNGAYDSFSGRINFCKHDNSTVLMDIKMSIIKDKYSDTIGYLIIGKEVRELKQLKSYFKITDREAEVIQNIINGDTNKDIADNLGVTENTMKRHITNIYNKLGVNNKVQMFGFLKDFNLLPEHDADRIVI